MQQLRISSSSHKLAVEEAAIRGSEATCVLTPSHARTRVVSRHLNALQHINTRGTIISIVYSNYLDHHYLVSSTICVFSATALMITTTDHAHYQQHSNNKVSKQWHQQSRTANIKQHIAATGV